jgi:hypothetical protein
MMGDSFPETNFLDEFLMKSSGLLNTFAPIFGEAAAKLVPVWLREPCRLPYSWRLKKHDVPSSGVTWKQRDKECAGHNYHAAHLIQLWRKLQ